MVTDRYKHGPGGLYDPLMAEIVRVETQTDKEKTFEIRLPDGLCLEHQNGQFVEVSIFGLGEAPFGVCSPSTQRETFELTIRATGSVTDAIHAMKAGDKVGIRGPMGRGFDVDAWKGKDLLIVGGGIGLVPNRSLIKYVLDRREDFGEVTVLYGTRDPGEILFRDELAEWDRRKDITFEMTVDRGDDTWEGNVGLITTLIPPIHIEPERTIAVITGPPIMYRFVVLELVLKGVTHDNIVMNLERMMKCGVGKCGHCAINDKYCCVEGPVFTLTECAALPEAL